MQTRKDDDAVPQTGEAAIEVATVPLWPDAGKALGLGRNTTYAAAKSGSIPTWQFGKLKRVSVGWLNKVRAG
jgi:hypothetical protein